MNSVQKRRITAEDLYELQIISGCEISPDGKKVVYAVQSVEKETRKEIYPPVAG